MYNIQEQASLQQIAESVELLDSCSQQIIKVMEDQIDAIIGSDAEKIERLSEVHGDLSKQFKIHEQEFIKELTSIIGTSKNQEKVRLISLKIIFPEAAEKISEWHSKLTSNTSELKRKHDQILQLLEFAMKQNARMMHSMFSASNEKNTHYVANGTPAGIPVGVAINQEI
ncbi:MAG: hypothetical protein CL670_08565 [Balneola sp.]|jgi:RNAse (barnase) inhibitor barstar|nr:hypothetical protein [Balneola sp.]MBE79191.1 hypothetical protein [Balneola sp.]|tara:strand:- start:175 stop:684 length:510 start_codon:yes stop_codon:yes gene_type:complete